MSTATDEFYIQWTKLPPGAFASERDNISAEDGF